MEVCVECPHEHVSQGNSTDSLGLVNLTTLMERSSGHPSIGVGLIDGPVAKMHPGLVDARIRNISDNNAETCRQPASVACQHGTFVAGILCAKRGAVAPAICPNCTLIIHPIFSEPTSIDAQLPSAKPEELARAILASVNAGARVVNLSLALARPSIKEECDLEAALDYAAKLGVLIVTAAGNQGTLGSTTITRHPWVIPVVACTNFGQPINQSNLSGSIGRRGLRAPGESVTSLGAEGQPLTFGGTSAAAPFVTGAIALLWSLFPAATASQLKQAITQAYVSRRTTIVPPLLNAWAAYQALANEVG